MRLNANAKIIFGILGCFIVILGIALYGITVENSIESDIVKTCIESGGTPTVNQYGTLTKCKQ